MNRLLLSLLLLIALPAHAVPSFIGFGTAQRGEDGADLTPALHANTQSGDTAVCIGAQKSGDGTPHISMGGSYTELSFDSSARSDVKIFAKTVSGNTDTGLIDFEATAGRASFVQCATFRGMLADVSQIVAHVAWTDNASQQNVDYPALTVSTANTVVIIGGFKEDDWNGDDIALETGMDAEIDDYEITTGQTLAFAWQYDIQTTGTNISAGAFDSASAGNSEGIGFAISLKPAALAAPTHTGAPAAGTSTATTIPTAMTVDQDLTEKGVLVTDGSGAPTCTQVQAGQDAAGNAAYATCSTSLTATVQGTCAFSSLSGAGAGTVRDSYFCGRNANGDTAVAAVADRYKLPAWLTAPTATCSTSSSCDVTGELDGPGTTKVSGCLKDSAAPDADEVTAGTCDAAAAALATASDDATLSSTLSGLTVPILDIHVTGYYVTAAKIAATALTDKMLADPPGWQYKLLTSVSATSPCKRLNDRPISPTIAADDVLKLSATVSPTGAALTVDAACDTEYADPNGTLRTAQLSVYDTSVGDWMDGGPTTIVLNNSAPVATVPAWDSGELLINGVAFTSVDLCAMFSDPDGDSFTCTSSDTGEGTGADKRPANTTTTNGLFDDTGAGPATTGDTTGSFTVTATDTWGDSGTLDVTWTAYDQVAVPDCDGLDAATCSALAEALNLSVLGTYRCGNGIAANDVISQDPAASSMVDPFSLVNLVVSNGACRRTYRGMTLGVQLGL